MAHLSRRLFIPKDSSYVYLHLIYRSPPSPELVPFRLNGPGNAIDVETTCEKLERIGAVPHMYVPMMPKELFFNTEKSKAVVRAYDPFEKSASRRPLFSPMSPMGVFDGGAEGHVPPQIVGP